MKNAESIKALLDHSMQEVLARLEEMISSSQKIHLLLEECFSNTKALQEVSRSLSSELDGLREIAQKMWMVQVMMKSNTADTEDLSTKAEPIFQAVKEVRDEFDVLLRRAEAGWKALHGCKTGAAQLTLEQFEKNHSASKKQHMSGALGTLKGELDTAVGRFVRGLCQMEIMKHQTSSSLTSFNEQLNKLRQGFLTGSDVKRTCSSLAEEARGYLEILEEKFGNDLPAAQHAERFVSLINRFTVLGHKKVVEEITGIDVEDGDEASSLTLF
jgi:hypothetical protein